MFFISEQSETLTSKKQNSFTSPCHPGPHMTDILSIEYHLIFPCVAEDKRHLESKFFHISIQCQGTSEIKKKLLICLQKNCKVSANKRQICKKKQGAIVYNVQIMVGERMPLLLSQNNVEGW
jgi:hypothetical protein